MPSWLKNNGSGLGDYIHYNKQNFIDFGYYRHIIGLRTASFGAVASRNARSETVEESITIAYDHLNSMHQNIRFNSRSKKELQQIEQFYTSLYTNDYNTVDTIVNADLSSHKDEYEQMLMTKIMNATSGMIDRSDFTVYSSKDLAEIDNVLKQNKTKYSQKKATTKINKSTLKSMAQKVRTNTAAVGILLMQTTSTGTLSQTMIDQLLSYLFACNEIYYNLQHILNNEIDLSEIQASNNRFYLDLSKANASTNILFQTVNLYNALANHFLQPDTMGIGTAGEYFGLYGAALADIQTKQKSLDIMKDTFGNVKSGVTGGKNFATKNLLKASTQFVDIKAFCDELNKNINDESRKYSQQQVLDGEAYIMGQPTQDTQDFVYNYDDDNNIFGVQQLSASMKTYANAFQQNISILGNYDKNKNTVTGVSVLNILSFLPLCFSNNYLNLLVEDGKHRINLNYNAEADDVIKYAVALRGFLGYKNDYAQKLVNFLIVLDRTGKQVRVLDTGRILNALTYGGRSFNDDYVTFHSTNSGPGIGLIEQGKIHNVWEPSSYKARITKILLAVHKMKISMSLNSANFWSID